MHRITSALLVLCLGLALLASGCERKPAATGSGSGSGPAPGPQTTDRVKLALNWRAEAEHGGYYAADVKGFYREEHLHVTIQPGGPGSGMTVVQQVALGRIDFAVTNADRVLIGRAAGAPIVAVMAPIQHSPRCVMVHSESGIDDFSKLGQLETLAMNDGPAFGKWLKHKGLLEGVKIVKYGGSVAPFLEGGLKYGQQGYSISEPFLVKQARANPLPLMVHSTGFDPYTSVLICSEETIAKRPELVRRMIKASIRGWNDYIVDPADTNAVIQSKNTEMSGEILAFGAKELVALVNLPGGPIGRMSGERWKTLADQLLELKLIDAGKVDPAQAFDVSLLPPK